MLLEELGVGTPHPAQSFDRGPTSVPGPLRSRLYTASLEAPLVQALRGRAREAGATVHGALCAAALGAAAHVRRPLPWRARLMSPVSLRERVAPVPDCLGSFLCAVETDHTLEAEEEVWRWAAAYRQELTRRVPWATRRLGLLALAPDLHAVAQGLQRTEPNARTATVEVSNLGRLPVLGPGVQLWFCQGNHYHGPLFNLSVATGDDGVLRACLSVPEPVVCADQARAFLQRWSEGLRRAADDPGLRFAHLGP